jgi:hypothetical protein
MAVILEKFRGTLFSFFGLLKHEIYPDKKGSDNKLCLSQYGKG